MRSLHMVYPSDEIATHPSEEIAAYPSDTGAVYPSDETDAYPSDDVADPDFVFVLSAMQNELMST